MWKKKTLTRHKLLVDTVQFLVLGTYIIVSRLSVCLNMWEEKPVTTVMATHAITLQLWIYLVG